MDISAGRIDSKEGQYGGKVKTGSTERGQVALPTHILKLAVGAPRGSPLPDSEAAVHEIGG